MENIYHTWNGQSKAEAAQKYISSKHGKEVARLSSKSKSSSYSEKDYSNIRDKVLSDGFESISKDEKLNLLGHDLNVINKEAKNLRDLKNNDALDDISDAKYDKLIHAEFEQTYRAEFGLTGKLKDYYTPKGTKLNSKIVPDSFNKPTKQQVQKKIDEYYKLKSDVMEKLKTEENITPKGYHTFLNTDRYGNNHPTFAAYYKIGKNTFHDDPNDWVPPDLKSLGTIKGKISSKLDINTKELAKINKLLKLYVKGD